MTQLESAKKNIITPLMKKIAKSENIPACLLSKLIKQGKAAILNNRTRKIKRPCAVGYKLRTKINANIGTSSDSARLDLELKKLKVALDNGADAVMDLSTGGNIASVRRQLLKKSSVPFGTVPIYEAAVDAQRKYGTFLKMTASDILSAIETQARDGVDFFTIHAGINLESSKLLKRKKRILSIVSRGGAILYAWMNHQKKENPLYEYFDQILEIAYRYDVTLSLGDALRPGSILDATDAAQIKELKILGKLSRRAGANNVQSIIEGPGHVPLNQIEKNVILEKKFCNQAPFYVLGPLVTDIAPGYDHITAAIGGAVAASVGADFLCYVTPSEHLCHPQIDDVKEGVIASRIAAHAADLAKQNKSASSWDKAISLARRNKDWKKQNILSIDPLKAKRYRKLSRPALADVCTMCGEYCSIKLTENCMRA